MKKISANILVLLALLPGNAAAQTLGTLIGTALQNNYQIAVLRNEARIAANNNTAGNAGQLPSAELNGTYSTSGNNTLQVFADGTRREGSNAGNSSINISALANWTAFDGFRVYARKDQLNYLEELGQLNARFYIEQSVADIAATYYELLYEKRLLRHLGHSLNISAFRLGIELKKKEIGSGTMISYGQAVVDHQTDSILLLAQQNRIEGLEIELKRVVNLGIREALTIADTAFDFLLLPERDSLVYGVKQHNSQLDRQRLVELIAETRLREEQANRYPRVDLFAGYQYVRSTSEVGFFQSNQNYGPTAGVSVNFNLFRGGEVNRNIRNAAIENENARLLLQQVGTDLEAEVHALYGQYLSVQERMALARKNVVRSRQVYAAAEQQLRQGAINGYDFRLTQLSLLNAELSLVQLEYSLKLLEISLNRMSGRVLEKYL
ncbi:MAG TPA: TolC family protein [Bacteroidales bacterium]|nr:TolC family protein [Bacteroidales bacterium]HRZ76288.1 TolC family protein [Bacteroidales bacterium]